MPSACGVTPCASPVTAKTPGNVPSRPPAGGEAHRRSGSGRRRRWPPRACRRRASRPWPSSATAKYGCRRRRVDPLHAGPVERRVRRARRRQRDDQRLLDRRRVGRPARGDDPAVRPQRQRLELRASAPTPRPRGRPRRRRRSRGRGRRAWPRPAPRAASAKATAQAASSRRAVVGSALLPARSRHPCHRALRHRNRDGPTRSVVSSHLRARCVHSRRSMAARVALVHDFLLDLRGAERVFAAICDAWPDADVFTAVYDERGTEGRFAAPPAAHVVPPARAPDGAHVPAAAAALPARDRVVRPARLRPRDLVLERVGARRARRPRRRARLLLPQPVPLRLVGARGDARGPQPARPARRCACCSTAGASGTGSPPSASTATSPTRTSPPRACGATSGASRPSCTRRSRSGASTRRRAGGSATHYMVLAELMAHKRIDVAVRAFDALGLPLARGRRRAGGAAAAAASPGRR